MSESVFFLLSMMILSLIFILIVNSTEFSQIKSTPILVCLLLDLFRPLRTQRFEIQYASLHQTERLRKQSRLRFHCCRKKTRN